jgi:hypothetical protein
MANTTHWSIEDMKKKGLVQNANGDFVPVKSLVAKKVEKLPYLSPKEFNDKLALPIGNKKIRNATKSVENGISFDSNLERTMYNMLTAAKIEFQFQATFILQEKFRYRDENIRAIVKIVDFWLPTRNIIIDTKGFSNDVSPMKHKMLKMALKERYAMEPEIIMPANKKDCDNVLNRLLYQP